MEGSIEDGHRSVSDNADQPGRTGAQYSAPSAIWRLVEQGVRRFAMAREIQADALLMLADP